MLKHFYLILLLFVLAGCAAQAPPGGGPEDKTAPAILDVFPPANTVNMDLKGSINIRFSEPVQASTIRRSITLFPLNTTDINLKIRRNRIVVSPLNSWDENTVYTFVIDRNVLDLRGNAIEQPLVYTFSTGSTIPVGDILGEIPNFNEKDRVLIGLARGIMNPDSVFSRLSYLTESGINGRYRFTAIPPGTYTIAGIVDHDRSKTYTPDFDDLVLPEILIVNMTDSASFSIDLGIVRGNFKTAKYVRGDNLYPRMTTLKFSKPLNMDTPAAHFRINGNPPDTLRIVKNDVYLYHSPIKDSLIILNTQVLTDTMLVQCGPFADTLTVKTLKDTTGIIRWEDNRLFLEPPISPDSLDVVALTPGDTTEQWLFSCVPGIYKPGGNWKNKNFSGKLVVNVPLTDELPQIRTWEDTISVTYKADSDSGRLILLIHNMRDQNFGFILQSGKRKYELICGNTTTCIFENVFAGEYSLWYYPDSNNNGRRDSGWLSPYIPPEILRKVADKIQIRARWDTEIQLMTDSDNRVKNHSNQQGER